MSVQEARLSEDSLGDPGPDELLDWVTNVARRLQTLKDPTAVVRQALRLSIPVLADVSLLVLRDAPGPDDGITVYAAHRDRTRDAATSELAAASGRQLLRLVDGSGPGEQVRWQWLPEVDTPVRRRLTRVAPGLPPLVDALGLESLLVLPLRMRGRTIGALLLGRTRPGESFSAAELTAAQVLSRRIAVAISATMPTSDSSTDRQSMHLFQHATAGVLVIDPFDRRIEAANPAAARMHGFDSPDDLVGCSFANLLPSEQRREFSGLLDLGPGEVASYDAVHVRADGSRFPVRVRVSVEGDEAARPLSLVAEIQDLTELRRAETRLRRAQRLETVGRLAGGVAHEVNNMMTVVLGVSELLEHADDIPGEHRADLAEIRKAAARASGITRELLVFSRQQGLQLDRLALDDVVAGVVPLLQSLLPADIAVRTELTSADCWVRADRSQLEQVLVNLAFNARDAMAHGGDLTIGTGRRTIAGPEDVPLESVAVRPGDYCMLTVTDTGVGMDADTQARLFEPFFTTKSVTEGTGLGLATVYGIVKQSDGYIWVASAPGAGTTFSVALPSADRVAAVTPAHETHPVSPGGGTEAVLVVEDEPAVRHLASRVLTAHGYRVVEAATGGDALGAVAERREPFDLVITDIVMPDIGGQELRNRLRAAQPQLPVLYMSAYTAAEVIQRGLLDSRAPFLQKPFTPEALRRRVREVLDAAARPGATGGAQA